MPEFGETDTRLPPFPAAARSPGVLQSLHRTSARHPEWWMILLSAAAWAFLIAGSRTSHDQASNAGARIVALGTMVVAMMLPLTVGRLRAMARSTPSLRHRAAGAFVAGYLAVWMLAMIAIDAVWRVALTTAGWAAAAGIVIAAAVLWEAASAEWRQARHEHGNRRDAGSVGSGAAAGASCVVPCWAQMAACVAFAHSLPVMAAFLLVQLHARYRRPASPALAALTVLGVCLVSLAFRMSGHSHHPGS